MISLQEKSYHCEKLSSLPTRPPPSPHSAFFIPIVNRAWGGGGVSLRREGCDYALKNRAKSFKKKEKLQKPHITHVPPLPPCRMLCGDSLAYRFGVGLSSPRACVKTNLAGVSYWEAEENIISPSFVGMNEQGLAADNQILYLIPTIHPFDSKSQFF